MASQQSLFGPIMIQSADVLEALLALQQVRGNITRRQNTSILMVLRQHLPATIELKQRTPKSMLYISINSAPTYTVNPRAHVGFVPT